MVSTEQTRVMIATWVEDVVRSRETMSADDEIVGDAVGKIGTHDSGANCPDLINPSSYRYPYRLETKSIVDRTVEDERVESDDGLDEVAFEGRSCSRGSRSCVRLKETKTTPSPRPSLVDDAGGSGRRWSETAATFAGAIEPFRVFKSLGSGSARKAVGPAQARPRLEPEPVQHYLEAREGAGTYLVGVHVSGNWKRTSEKGRSGIGCAVLGRNGYKQRVWARRKVGLGWDCTTIFGQNPGQNDWV
ncbi:hypothetical protein SISNIDRAFT_471198 [Sistotremastrum niveocremeum HHB9708]|uniref:Uncharacterized protein n=1 Tax=Sistotremastrum niveocremeum HHB9708 TaxID=1314777 RepID=A0A164MYI5_9AGAM|nr:hypothetical protein SISNIDRAFT_471198 [Sistotremastrum niveocremeum HHB9708]